MISMYHECFNLTFETKYGFSGFVIHKLDLSEYAKAVSEQVHHSTAPVQQDIPQVPCCS